MQIISKTLWRLLYAHAFTVKDHTKIFAVNCLMSLTKKGMRYALVSDLKEFLFRSGFDYEWLMFGIYMNDEKRRFDKTLSKIIYDIYNLEKL